MRSFLVVLISLAACTHPAAVPAASPKHVAAAWRGPEILALVPADTPYLAAVLEPPPAALRAQLYAQAGTQVVASLRKTAAMEGKRGVLAAALYSELDGVDPSHVFETLGLRSDGRMVLYGLGIWPVIRFEIIDDVRVRQLVGRLIQATGSDLQPRTVGRAMLYTVPDGKLVIVFGVIGREVVAAVVPAATLDRTLPQIIGTEPPAHSLRDAPHLPELLATHRFVPNFVGYLDVARVMDTLGPGFDPACRDDFARIATVVPRLVLGYRRIDERGFDMAIGLEVPPATGKALSKLHTVMPELPTAAHPLFAMRVAIDGDAFAAWFHDVTAHVRAHPLRCDAFTKINERLVAAAGELDKPLPPILQGIHGIELVLDDVTVLPPSGAGELIVDGRHIAETVHRLLAKWPQLALVVAPDGHAIELPLARMGFPPTISSAHFALRPTRAVFAVGDHSAERASMRTAGRAVRAPLLTLFYDLPKLRERFPTYFAAHDFGGLSSIGSTELSIDTGDEGLTVDVVGAWATTAPQTR